MSDSKRASTARDDGELGPGEQAVPLLLDYLRSRGDVANLTAANDRHLAGLNWEEGAVVLMTVIGELLGLVEDAADRCGSVRDQVDARIAQLADVVSFRELMGRTLDGR